MNALTIAIVFVLSLFAGALEGCDSNPTPHPAGDVRTYDVAEAGAPSGREDDFTPEPGPGEDDPDNAFTDGESPAAGVGGCDTMADAEVFGGGDAGDGGDSNDTVADGDTLPSDCGPSEVAPTPSNDNVDRVE